MQIKLLNTWKERFQTLKPPTRVCKICFQKIKTNNLYICFNKNHLLCSSCYKKLIPTFNYFKISNYQALSLYNYDEELEGLIYQFKGCYDIELAPVFLERHVKELSIFYKGYIVMPIPSFYLDDERRGFNHVFEIFKYLKLPMIKILEKTDAFKQANHSSKDRTNIHKYLKLINGDNLFGKKVLIVDDVYTTGSTMKAAIKLVESLHPKDIKILVLSKTLFKKTTNT